MIIIQIVFGPWARTLAKRQVNYKYFSDMERFQKMFEEN